MVVNIKLAIIYFSCCLMLRITGVNINVKDAPYDVINFKIPSSIWKKAWRDQPVASFKSQATIVLPIYVSEDYSETESDFEEDEEDLETQDDSEVENNPEIDDNTEIEQTTELITNTNEDSPVEDVVTPPVNTSTALPETTTQIIEDEEPSNTTDAPGQGLRLPCACSRRQCGCCTRMILPRLNMNTCGNITFIPRDFLFDVRMTINNRTVLRRRVSASNPPPICFNPVIAPFVQVCAILSNIRTQNRNIFACLNIKANIAGFTVYTASFRCFGLGGSGVQTGLRPRPVSSGPAPVNLFGGSNNNNNNNGFFGGGSTIFGGGGPIGALGNAISGILRLR